VDAGIEGGGSSTAAEDPDEVRDAPRVETEFFILLS
jgi:hypothetical protein